MEFRPISPKSGQTQSKSPKFGHRIWPKIPGNRSTSVEFGPNAPKRKADSTQLGCFGPESTQCGPTTIDARPTSANIGQLRPGIGQLWPSVGHTFGQHWPDVEQLWPEVGHTQQSRPLRRKQLDRPFSGFGPRGGICLRPVSNKSGGGVGHAGSSTSPRDALPLRTHAHENSAPEFRFFRSSICCLSPSALLAVFVSALSPFLLWSSWCVCFLSCRSRAPSSSVALVPSFPLDSFTAQCFQRLRCGSRVRSTWLRIAGRSHGA